GHQRDHDNLGPVCTHRLIRPVPAPSAAMTGSRPRRQVLSPHPVENAKEASMRKTGLSALMLSAMLVLPWGTPAAAQTRVWVASNGTDTATCGGVPSLPCATFQRAHDNAAAGGQISVLTPGDYGPVAITKAISITNDGSGEANVLVPSGGTGISINAGRGDIIGLRGLV